MAWKKKIKKFWGQCKRVLRVTKKPDAQEYKLIAKVSAVGILAIGFMGFLLFVVEAFLGSIILTLVTMAIIVFIMYFKREE